MDGNDKEGKLELWVYRYSFWDASLADYRVSDEYATLETIKMGLGVPIFTSALRVPAVDVHEGFYRQTAPTHPRIDAASTDTTKRVPES